ncbi:MAG: arginine--tRNA ligase [Eubacteriales bacterium]
MLKLKKRIAEALAIALASMTPEPTPAADELTNLLEYPPDSTMGDLALPCFRFAKVMRRAPKMIAETIAEQFTCEGIASVSAVNGYLNFKISSDFYANAVLPEILEKGADYGKLNIGEGKTVVLDYSSPNICKPFHIGHLGTTVIGHSIRLTHEFMGYHCIGINYLGDWGTQFGKLITAYRKWGSKEEVEAGGIDYLVDIYVRFHAEAENDPTLNDLARYEFHKLEEGDEENLALWKWFKEISLEEYEKTYKQLGITFDSYLGESFYTDKMPAQVQKLREMNLLKIDDGASIVDLSEYNLPPCLILKRDGSTLYPTRDIAAAVYRHDTYDFDKCIYVTANQQSLHFAQWFKVVELMGYDWYDKLVHVPYGTISVEGVKLSTRHGNMLLLRDVFAAAIDKVSEIMATKSPDLPDRDKVAEEVGVGAVIFYYLLGGISKDSSFVMSDALSFEGNTGPYVQYTYARTCSILDRAGDIGEGEIMLTAPEECELLKTLSRFSECVLRAMKEYEPSNITRFILDVAAAFNRFYHECPILSAESEAVKNTRLLLTKATNTVLGNALPLICLKTPRKI